jgi:glutathione synthase/RimK-type ligase-like ATP-grasp enzyme
VSIVSRNPIVIIAPDNEWHAVSVLDRLRAMGADAMILDTGRFPDQMRISLGERLDDVEIDGQRIAPSAVYIRDLALNPQGPTSGLADGMAADWRRTLAALHERSDFVMSLLHRWEAAGVPVYNPLSAFPRITKPFQIALLAAAGLPVPPTSWTNDPERVRRFAAAGPLIYKPVAGGAATRKLGDDDLGDERLARLRAAPVCFQELLPGTDLRIYVVDGEVVASIAITADAIDFRGNELALDQFPIDDQLRDICVRATAVLGLRFTGMDVKLDTHGEPRILELNPSPMFVGFDQRSGTDVLGALCRALMRGAGQARAIETSTSASPASTMAEPSGAGSAARCSVASA